MIGWPPSCGRLGDAATWAELETVLNGTVLRVYEVDGDRVRLDSTSAKTYAGVSEGGLFQFGQSKTIGRTCPK